jgi:hypothetical protein
MLGGPKNKISASDRVRGNATAGAVTRKEGRLRRYRHIGPGPQQRRQASAEPGWQLLWSDTEGGKKNVEVAKDFLRYLIQPQVNNEYLKTGLGRFVPCMPSIGNVTERG